MSQLNTLAAQIHLGNVEKGFYEDEKNIAEMLCLIHSEISEALEAYRQHKTTKPSATSLSVQDIIELEDDEQFKKAFEQNIKDTFNDEIADATIRLLDLCGFKQIPISEHMLAERRFNAMRPYKHGKKF